MRKKAQSVRTVGKSSIEHSLETRTLFYSSKICRKSIEMYDLPNFSKKLRFKFEKILDFFLSQFYVKSLNFTKSSLKQEIF